MVHLDAPERLRRNGGMRKYYNRIRKSRADPEGGTGAPDPPPPPPENHKNIGFLISYSNTGPDPLKNHKATKPA